MKIRISAALRQRIEEAAKTNNRTMNGEVAARLEKSFEAEEAASDALSNQAAKRLLAIGMPGADQGELPERLEDRFRYIEERLTALERRRRGKG